jgi:CRP/FNR family transcriptional regulator, nitrogen oxide reductase regulator
MRKELLLELLAASETFVGLSYDALGTILKAGTLRHWARDDYLIQQGNDAAHFALVVRGTAKLIQVTPDGHQVLVRFVGRGQEFGLIAALSGFVYPLSVQAVEPCSALVWQGDVLADLMQRFPIVALNALRIMVIRNQETQRRYQELLTQRVEQRVAQALVRLADQLGTAEDGMIRIDLALTREDLGEFAGTTLYSVSRVLSVFERNGLIDAQRDRILIRKIDEVRQIAGADASGSDIGVVACGASCVIPKVR